MKLLVILEDPERVYTIPLVKFFDILQIELTEEDVLSAIQKVLVNQ